MLKIFNSSDFLKTVPVDTLHQMRGKRTIKMKRRGPGIRWSSQEKYRNSSREQTVLTEAGDNGKYPEKKRNCQTG